jgi:RNA polymerase sigma-70 factor (ECF subfamily)
MHADDANVTALLSQAAAGQTDAIQTLLQLHRDRLKRMIAIYFDNRLLRRADPSDVVQETLAEAARRLPIYAAQPLIPFYPWLRRLAQDNLLKLKHFHAAQKRAVHREEALEPTDASAMHLAERLAATGTGPSERAMREERKKQVQSALAKLPPRDREVLVLRYLEQLSVEEATAVLGISEEAYMKRHFRAIQRLRRNLGQAGGSSS